MIYNYNRVFLFLFVLLIFKTSKGTSQLVSFSDHYVLYPVMLNPAFAGDRDALSIASYYSQKWLGMKGAPENLNLIADFSGLKGKLGFGFQYQNESYGVSSLNKLTSLYAYRIKMYKSELGFGLGAGFLLTQTAWSKLSAEEIGDEMFLIDSKNYFLPEFSFGIKFRHKNFYTGFSVPDLLSYAFNSEKNNYDFKADLSEFTYQLFGGNSFKLSPQFNILPSALIGYSKGNQLKYDVSLIGSFYEKIWIGVLYHSTQSVTGLVQFGISDQLLFAYSYQVNFGKISIASKGSQEFMLRYEFRFKVNAASPLKF